jgi:tetratricopeptide (TPR) repeat protein
LPSWIDTGKDQAEGETPVKFFECLCRLTRLGLIAAFMTGALSVGAFAEEDAEPDPADSPLNEIPMYGKKRLPESLQRANRELVRDAYRTGVSLTTASNHAIEEGWDALAEGDMSTAIRRFNHGWLLDRTNGAVYWGFGVVLYKRDGDTKGALKMLARARRLQPDNPYLLVDFGRVLEEVDRVKEATILFLDAVSLDPKTDNVYVGLVRAYMKDNDLQNALMFAYEGKDKGDPISDKLIGALEELSAQKPAEGTPLKYPAAPEWDQ